MILSDGTIRKLMRMKQIVIEPQPKDWQIQPASIDLTLAGEFMFPFEDRVHREQHFALDPGACVLGTTVERIEVPDFLVARVEGKSSWGRRFLQVHSTAGFIDPGFRGMITLELTNLLPDITQPLPIGSAIAQITFESLDHPVQRPYGHATLGNHYQDQAGVQPSWLSR